MGTGEQSDEARFWVAARRLTKYNKFPLLCTVGAEHTLVGHQPLHNLVTWWVSPWLQVRISQGLSKRRHRDG